MHTVVYGGGAQVLTHVPIDRLGRPVRIDSATYTIVDLRAGLTSSDRTIVASTAASLGTETEAPSAACGRSEAYPRRIPVASTTGFVAGRRYLISDGDEREIFTLSEIDTDAYLYASAALRGDYSTDATVEAIELEATFPSSEADDEDETVEDSNHPGYQLTWSYTIDRRDYLVPEIVHVRRTTLAPWIDTTELTRGHPSLARRTTVDALQDAVSIASEEVAAELAAGGLDPHEYRHSNVGKIAVRYRALEYAFMQFSGEQDERMTAEYGNRYRQHIGQILSVRPKNARIVSDADGTTLPIEMDRKMFWRR